MRDALKDFIENHRAEFDDPVPVDLWARIGTGIGQNTTLLSKHKGGTHSALKKLAAMIKYGFGASVLVAGTILLVNSQKEKETTNNLGTPSVVDSSQLFSTPRLNAGAVLLNDVKSAKKQPAAEPAPEPENIPEVKAGPLAAEDTTSVKAPEAMAVSAAVVPYAFPAFRKDSLKEGLTLVDTVFNGVKKIEISAHFCHVNVRAVPGDKVSLHGRIAGTAGRTVSFGLLTVRKSEYILKFTQKDSLLVIWMEEKKDHKTKSSLKSESENSVLDLDVPVKTGLTVNNNSGNLFVSGLENKTMLLQTSFGNIKAEDIVSDLTVRSSSGKVTLKRITGLVKTNTSFGSQVIEGLTGNLKLNTSSGKVTVSDLKGDAEVNSSFGSQHFERVTGNITCNASSGALHVRHIKGNVYAVSSFGTQNYEDVEGDISANASSGSIRVEGAKGMLALSTTFGNISGRSITLVNSGNFKTSSGSISMDLLNTMEELSFDLSSGSGRLLVDKNDVKNQAEEKLQIRKGPVLVRGVSSFGNQIYR